MKTKFTLLFLCLICSIHSAVSQTQVIAHRGFWDAEGSAQNSISALDNASEAGCYGSEFDVVISEDGVAIVNHDNKIDKLIIEETPYATLKKIKLKNGEKLPTLKKYLKRGKKNTNTKLILEIKPLLSQEKEIELVTAVLKLVRKYKLENQVEYISFSLNVCKALIDKAPNAPVAYLNGELSPTQLKQMKFTGLDYHHSIYKKNPSWIKEAQEKGLTTNVWTVNDPELMKYFIAEGIDYITTDAPTTLQELLD